MTNAIKTFILSYQEFQDVTLFTLTKNGFDIASIGEAVQSGEISAINGYDALGDSQTLYFA